MALFRKFFYRKPPDGLLEISKRVYVFDSCFKTDVLEGDEYKVYMEGIVAQLHDQFPDASFVVFNFREGVNPSQISSILSEYDMAVMEYPRQYEGCPLLTMEMLHHFLRSCESWLLLGQQNILLMHCERGGWPVLAFMLAALLVYRKQYAGEQRALDMIYKQAPRELLQLLSPLNPLPSQLRYLHYISNRNVGSQWPPLDRALTLNCIILRCLPNCDGMDGCRPLFRIYGQDPLLAADPTPKVLFSTPKKSKSVHFYKQDCELVKFDIHSHIQGDVVLECISLDDDLEREQMMFRVMFNTAFIRSNILMLDRDSIDILWDAKDRFPKDFRVEILFSEMNAANSLISLELISGEDTEGLSTEAFTRVNEIFNNFDWLDTNADAATQVLQHIASSKSLQEKVDAFCPYKSEVDILLTKSSADTLQEEDVSGETYDRNKKSLTSSPKSLQHSSSVPLLTDSANYIQEPSSLTTSSISGSTISLKSSQHELSVLLSTTSQSYTEEISRANAHILLSPSPPSAPSPLAPKEVVLAPPSIPLVPLAFATKLEVDTVGEAPASFEPPFRTIKSSITKVPPSPDQKLSYSAPQNSIPSVPSHHGNSTQSTSAPPPPTPYKKISAPSTSAGLEKSASPVRHEALSGNMASKLIPSPPSPPLITSKSPHTSSLPFTKESDLAVPGPYPGSAAATSASPPPPHIFPKHSVDFDSKASSSTPLPPPPAPPDFVKGPTFADISGGKCANCEVIPPPPPCGLSALTLGGHGRLLTRTSRFMLYNQSSTRKSNLKPLHWIKVTRAVQGSLWAESPDCDEFLKTPEFDMSELERLFSVAMPTPNLQGSGSKSGRSLGSKSDKIHLIDLRRANNCEIMLTKVKMPLNDLLSSVLTLDDSVLDVDQIENLIKFCPTKEEMELLTGYNGDKGNLGKCEQYFLELMKVPRVESKLRVFSFKIQFRSQVTDLKRNLNVVNSSAEETRSSIKLKRIMQTILSLGNALNQGTARGSAVGFRLDSLLKLSETRARNNKITLMHYLCKVLAEQLPELIDFPKDLVSLEVAAKMQLKILAEEMQAINKGLEKVEQELAASERDGPVSQVFCETLKEFLVGAEAEVKALTLLYSSVGRNADALALYFGEDPARCPFEQVVTTLLNFVKMFMRAHEENCKHLELEKKKALKEAESEKVKTSSGTKEL